MAALNPPAKAEAPEPPPKLLNTPSELAVLARVAAKGAADPAAAVFPKAGKRDVAGGALEKAENGVLTVAFTAAGAAKLEIVCKNGEAAAAAAGAAPELPPVPNREVEPREDASEPSPREDDCAHDCEGAAPNMLTSVVGCEVGRIMAPNTLAEDAAAAAVGAVAEDAEGPKRGE